MTIKAVIFDVGGVLEITPSLGLMPMWEQKLRMQPGELDARLADVWRDGSVGAISEEQAYAAVCERLKLNNVQLDEFIDDIWTEYLGTLNVELTDFFKSLRPRYKTAIISNSFVGARERERACYDFESMTDAIIYSHEEGFSKPDEAIYRLACNRLDIAPAEAIFLDDNQVMVEAATAAGMQAVLFENNADAMAHIARALSNSTDIG